VRLQRKLFRKAFKISSPETLGRFKSKRPELDTRLSVLLKGLQIPQGILTIPDNVGIEIQPHPSSTLHDEFVRRIIFHQQTPCARGNRPQMAGLVRCGRVRRSRRWILSRVQTVQAKSGPVLFHKRAGRWPDPIPLPGFRRGHAARFEEAEDLLRKLRFNPIPLSTTEKDTPAVTLVGCNMDTWTSVLAVPL